MQLVRTKEWRESRGFTQRALAAEAGISEVTVARLETGHSSTPSTARKIARALGISPADLLERPPVPLGEASETGLAALDHEVVASIPYTPETLAEAAERALDVAGEARAKYDAAISEEASHALVWRDLGDRIEIAVEPRAGSPTPRKPSERLRRNRHKVTTYRGDEDYG